MKDLKFDFETNDLVIESGAFAIVEYKERVLQQVRIALNIWRGEWFLNADKGIDYINGFKNKKLLESDMKNVVLAVSGVDSVDSFSIVEIKESAGKITFVVDMAITIDGELNNMSVEV